MGRSGHFKPYEQIKDNSFRLQAHEIAATAIRNTVFNNDFLCRIHRVTLASIIRYIEANELSFCRRYYELIRSGQRQGFNLMWSGLFYQFWIDNGYKFKLSEMLGAGFPEYFFNHHAGECHTMELKYASYQEYMDAVKFYKGLHKRA